MQTLEHAGNRLLRAADQGGDRAVGFVTDPPDETELLRLVARPNPEANALHPPEDSDQRRLVGLIHDRVSVIVSHAIWREVGERQAIRATNLEGALPTTARQAEPQKGAINSLVINFIFSSRIFLFKLGESSDGGGAFPEDERILLSAEIMLRRSA